MLANKLDVYHCDGKEVNVNPPTSGSRNEVDYAPSTSNIEPSRVRVAMSSGGTSTDSEEYETEDSDLDFSVHSEFIPISRNTYGGLPLRSMSTSDLMEGASCNEFRKEYQTRRVRFPDLFQLWHAHCAKLNCVIPDDDEDTLSTQSDIPRSTCSLSRHNALSRSKSTSELDKYSKLYSSDHFDTDFSDSGLSHKYSATNSSCSWYSKSDYEYSWDMNMFGSDAMSSSMSTSNIQPYLSRGCSNNDEFLISIYSNPNLQRSFSLGDIQQESKSTLYDGPNCEDIPV